jgi:hypothetical protein
MTGEVQFVENRIEVDGQWVQLEHPIQDAFRDGDRTVVLFDPDSAPGAFANLICLGRDGKRLWQADLPERGRADVYYRISSRRPLVVNSFSSYKCEIDRATGRIIGKEFMK